MELVGPVLDQIGYFPAASATAEAPRQDRTVSVAIAARVRNIALHSIVSD
jgi:hypothetical protein